MLSAYQFRLAFLYTRSSDETNMLSVWKGQQANLDTLLWLVNLLLMRVLLSADQTGPCSANGLFHYEPRRSGSTSGALSACGAKNCIGDWRSGKKWRGLISQYCRPASPDIPGLVGEQCKFIFGEFRWKWCGCQIHLSTLIRQNRLCLSMSMLGSLELFSAQCWP